MLLYLHIKVPYEVGFNTRFCAFWQGNGVVERVPRGLLLN